MNGSKKYKVLQINKLYCPWIGGVEKVVQEIAEGLRDKVDMKVLVCEPKRKGRDEIINGVRVSRAGSLGIFFSMPVSLSFPLFLRRLSKDRDILHFHMPFPLGDISYFLTRPRGRIVIWWHSDVVRQRNILSLYRPLLKKFLSRVDKIIVATPWHIESSSFLKDFRNKCEIIPFGIDIRRFGLNENAQEKVGNVRDKYGSKIILFVGRLIYYKGVEYLLHAMKDIDANLILIGEGPLRNYLQQLTIKLGIEKKIFFLGNLENEETPIYYHSCCTFILPSIANSEAFGLVQLEAMACGKPVINTSLPTGVPWVSIDGMTGITVPPKNSEALARAINKLLQEADLREKYGKNAIKRVQEQFTIERMLNRIYHVYKELMEK